MFRCFLAFIAVCIGIWLRRRKQHFMFFRNLNIPGPEPSIFFGNILEIKRKNPVEAQKEWIKQYGKVLGYFNGHKPILLVADADLLRFIQVKDFSDFVDRGNPISNVPRADQKALTQATGREWKEMRSVMTPAFTTSKLKMMTSPMTESIESLTDIIKKKAESGEEFNIYEQFQALTMEVICKTAFGVEQKFIGSPGNPLLNSVKRLFKLSFSFILVLIASFPELMTFVVILKKIVTRASNKGRDPVKELLETSNEIIRLRSKDASARRSDILQNLLDAQHPTEVKEEYLAAGDEADRHAENEAKRNSLEQISSTKKALDSDTISKNTFVILVAGYETTSNTLASATLQLVHHPEIQERVRKEIQEVIQEKGRLDYNTVQNMKYLDCVISETLRLYSPIHSTTRQAVVDKQYGDIRIPKDLVVQIPIKALHTNPDYWKEPQEFNPDRFLPESKQSLHPFAFQGFGAGPRNCIGMRFAQMEMKLALARILQMFRLEPGHRTEANPPKIDVDFILARPREVYLKAVKL